MQANKKKVLKKRGALNPKPENVKDENFNAGSFFDANDLLQVKYEMLRRVECDQWPVSKTATAFGFSRPSFYEIQEAFREDGLAGLIPQKRGPKGGHKVTDDVLVFIDGILDESPSTPSRILADKVSERFEISVHPSSIDRALARRKKKGGR